MRASPPRSTSATSPTTSRNEPVALRRADARLRRWRWRRRSRLVPRRVHDRSRECEHQECVDRVEEADVRRRVSAACEYDLEDEEQEQDSLPTETPPSDASDQPDDDEDHDRQAEADIPADDVRTETA